MELTFSFVCLGRASTFPSETCKTPPEQISANSAFPFKRSTMLMYLLSQIFCFNCWGTWTDKSSSAHLTKSTGSSTTSKENEGRVLARDCGKEGSAPEGDCCVLAGIGSFKIALILNISSTKGSRGVVPWPRGGPSSNNVTRSSEALVRLGTRSGAAARRLRPLPDIAQIYME